MKKNRILKILYVLITLLWTTSVSAGSVTLGLDGESPVRVNQTFDIIVQASSINGFTEGLATAQGDISFDSSYLEYVKYSTVSSPLSVSYGVSTKRFVALGLSGETIKSSGNLFTLTFKALQPGKTTITINKTVVGDTKAIIHTAKVLPKTIEILGEDTSKEPTPTPPTSNQDDNAGGKKNTGGGVTKSSDKTLSDLKVNNAVISPNFDKTITEYTVIVGKETDKLLLDFTSNHPKASVKVIGNENLEENKINKVEIIVTAEDGTTQKYILNVTKEDQQVKRGLSNITAKEGKLSPTFNSDVMEYTIQVGKKVNSLTLNILPIDKDSKIEVIGNENFEVGKNVVLIKVTDTDGFINYYTLHVKKNSQTKLFGIPISYLLGGFLGFLILLLLFLLLKKKNRKEETPQPEEKRIERIIVEPNISLKSEFMMPNENDLVSKIVERLADNNVVKNQPEKEIIPSIKEEQDDYIARHAPDEEETKDDLYDDVVTKEELIGAIEEGNAKKLKMLIKQEEANRLKEELKKEEND